MKTLLMVLVVGLGSILTGCPDDGRDGLDGWMGEDGEDGEDGEEGEGGSNGDDGQAGDAGVDGEDGEDGENGPPGPGTRETYTGNADSWGMAYLDLGVFTHDNMPIIQAWEREISNVGLGAGWYPAENMVVLLADGNLKIRVSAYAAYRVVIVY